MNGVVTVNPADTSYDSKALETMRLSQLHAGMREKDPEGYEAHIQVCVDLLKSQAAHKTIEPYWAVKVGEGAKSDAVKHLMAEASKRIMLEAQTDAIRGAQKPKR